MYIHTFEIKKQISKEESCKIQKALRMDKDKWKGEISGMSYWGLSDKGILIHTYLLKKKGYYAYYIIYRISAQRVIENDNFVGLFDCKNYCTLEEKIDNLLLDKYKHLPLVEDCKLSRLDFCINAILQNQEQVKAYIKMARKANIPHCLVQRVYYSECSHRKKPLEDDMSVFSKDYIEVSIYNKFKQMEKEEKELYSDKDFNAAENIVRIEIRCKKKKLKELKKKFKIGTINEFMLMADKIGRYLYKYYLSEMFGKGEICTLKKAKNNLSLGNLKPENTKALTEFLEFANKLRSVHKAYEIYCETDGRQKTRDILNKLNYVDTSYVTIPVKDAKLFSGDCIPSPLDLVADCLDLEDDWRRSNGY